MPVPDSIRVVAFDMDGTLLRSDGTVSRRTLAALTECSRRGMRLVVATGRRQASALRSLPPALQSLPGVFLNGAHVYLDGERIHHDPMPLDDALALARHIEEHYPQGTLYADVGGLLFVNRENDYPEARFVPRIADIITEPPCKMVVNLGDSLPVDAIRDRLPPGCKMISTVGGQWAEIVATGVSKADGVSVLTRRWGLTLADVIAFGDEMNDLEMVAEVGIGVAMGNAVTEIKSAAARVALANNDDGMAIMLESLLRGELN